jgi:hypothetical protein
MVLGGVEIREAWRRIEQSRGRDVPDTHQQRNWALNFAEVNVLESE